MAREQATWVGILIRNDDPLPTILCAFTEDDLWSAMTAELEALDYGFYDEELELREPKEWCYDIAAQHRLDVSAQLVYVPLKGG